MRDIKLNWTPSEDERVDPLLNTVLPTWQGTPCGDGPALKGTRANCATFVWALLVELYHMRRAPRFVFPMRSVWHKSRPGVMAMRKFRQTFPIRRLRQRNVRPGDIIVAGLAHGGPSHLMVVGTERNVVWHCTNDGVQKGGWVLPRGARLMHVYRCNIEGWF